MSRTASGLWESSTPRARGSLRGSALFGSLTPLAVPGGLLWQHPSSYHGITPKRQSSASAPPTPKPKGRPKGSKDGHRIRRAGHPSPRKGISKYTNIKPPPTAFCSTRRWESLDERSRQNECQRYRIQQTNKGVEARLPCERCQKKGLGCRLFRTHQRGRSCGECMKVKSSCAGATRVDDQPNPGNRTQAPQLLPYGRSPEEVQHGPGGHEEYGGGTGGLERSAGQIVGAA